MANPAKTVDKAVKPVTGAASTVMKPLVGAVDSVANVIPGSKSVPTISANTSGVFGSLTSAKTVGPVAGLTAGIMGGYAVEKLVYETDRGMFGYGAAAVKDDMSAEERQVAQATWKGQQTNRLLVKIGLGLAGLGLASLSKNGVVQYAGLGVAGIETVHGLQKHAGLSQ